MRKTIDKDTFTTDATTESDSFLFRTTCKSGKISLNRLQLPTCSYASGYVKSEEKPKKKTVLCTGICPTLNTRLSLFERSHERQQYDTY